MKKILFSTYTLVGFAVTVILGFSYHAFQQLLRMGANDPQVQIAEDLADSLSNGMPLDVLKPTGGLLDMKKSLSPFFVVYDDKGAAVVGSAMLDQKAPMPPAGSLEAAKNQENRFTWEPTSDLRVATVIKSYTAASSSGYVLVGRSMKETELRLKVLMQQVAIALAVSLVGIVGFALVNMKRAKKEVVSSETSPVV